MRQRQEQEELLSKKTTQVSKDHLYKNITDLCHLSHLVSKINKLQNKYFIFLT